MSKWMQDYGVVCWHISQGYGICQMRTSSYWSDKGLLLVHSLFHNALITDMYKFDILIIVLRLVSWLCNSGLLVTECQWNIPGCHIGAFPGLQELQVLDFWLINDYILSLFEFLGCLLSDLVSWTLISVPETSVIMLMFNHVFLCFNRAWLQ